MGRSILFAMLVLAGLVSCDNDVDVNAEWKDITVVYGLMDQSEDTNWIRIGRAFLGEQDALIMAQDPDLLYYDTLTVFLDEYNNNALVRSIQLELDSVNRQKEAGAFTTEGFRLYRTQQTLNEDFEYRARIVKPGDVANVSARTLLVKDFSITRPLGGGQQINLTSASGQEVVWDNAEEGRLYQLTLRFYYLEQNRANKSDTVNKYIDWTLPSQTANNLDGNGSQRVSMQGESFFRFLAGHLEHSEQVNRYARRADIMVTAGADELNTYINVNKPATGIVQERPEYTNVENGIGIFSSRYTKVKDGFNLSNRTLDSLALGTITCGLRFAQIRTSSMDTCFCVNGDIVCIP